MISEATKAITLGKFRARSSMPYLTHIWSMMRTVETDAVETLAVDKHCRLYVNPAYLKTLSPEMLGYVLLHETLHVVLHHCQRFAEACPFGTERESYAWNVAVDLVVQQLLARHNMAAEPPGIVRIDGQIDPEATGGKLIRFRSITGLRDGMTAEQYYSLVLPYIVDKPPGGKGNTLDPADAGSNSDGEARDYEEEPGDSDQTMVRRAVRNAGKEIEATGCKPGSVAGDIAATIAAATVKQPDPFDQLRRVVSRSVASSKGEAEYTYAVMCRRQGTFPIRRRGYRLRAPECSIIVDTSGSMSGSESRAVATVALGLRRVQQPRVVCYDHCLQSAKRLSSVAKFKWEGNGGTDMTTAIEQEDKRRPDAIVVITDGETRWPERRTKAKLIIALVRGSCPYFEPPEWAKVIDLTKEVRSYVA